MSVSFPSIEFFCPIPTRGSRADAAHIHEKSIQWMESFGACDSKRLHHYANDGMNELLADQFPEARTDYLQLMIDLTTFTILWDDVIENDLKSEPRARTAAKLLRRIHVLEHPELTLDASEPWLQAMGDIAHRAWTLMPPDRYTRWIALWLRAYLGNCWEILLLDGDHRPSIDEYLTLRRHTHGLAVYTEIMDLAHDRQLAIEELNSLPVMAFSETATVIAMIDNDIYSEAKEVLTNKSGGASILCVMSDHFNCEREEALRRSIALRDQIKTLHLKLREQLCSSGSDDLAAYARDAGQLIRVCLDTRFVSRYTAPFVDGKGAVPLERSAPSLTVCGVATEDELPPLPTFSWWWEVVDGA